MVDREITHLNIHLFLKSDQHTNIVIQDLL